MPIWTVCKVQKDHHFVAKGNFYSVPIKYIGEEITIRIGLKTVAAYYKHQIIKSTQEIMIMASGLIKKIILNQLYII